MMDGQVAAIRRALETNGYADTILMSYSTKFASALYGPFRDAADSSPQSGDRKAYQLDPLDLRQALRESKMDEEEGADILMVKPATFYLDVISEVRKNTDLPLAAYNVSGEYAMIHALASSGGGDLQTLAMENLAAIQRAGADMILTYWANILNIH
jgi:porphobilinogen synthase